MIRSEISTQPENFSRLVGPIREVILSARSKLDGCILDQTHFGRAYISYPTESRLYVVHAHFPHPDEIGSSIILTGVQLDSNGKYDSDLVSFTLPSRPELVVADRFSGFDTGYYTSRGLSTLAEELKEGTSITRGEYFAHLPRRRTLLND